jgi:hypothetical protein
VEVVVVLPPTKIWVVVVLVDLGLELAFLLLLERTTQLRLVLVEAVA